VKCLFAIDAIAAVYRADPARFESGPRAKPIRNSDQQSTELTIARVSRIGLAAGNLLRLNSKSKDAYGLVWEPTE